MIWEQCRYGKIVQTVDGPIVKGSEHDVTGFSVGFARSLEDHCRPDVVGIGASEQFIWQDHPWFERGGGIIVKPLEVEGASWVVACRVRGLSEGGRGLPGRIFTQAHYLVVSASAWSAASASQLDQVLRAEPTTGIEKDLPAVTTDDDMFLDGDLPPDWLTEAGDVLEVLMSGHGLSVQDWKREHAEFLDLASLCLCALPRAMAWRVTVGTGLIEMDGSVAIANGMRAMDGVRVIAGERRGDDDIDLTPGRRYVAWLEQVARDCSTPRQLTEAVASALPLHAAYDAIPIEASWQEAARLVSGVLGESAQLQDLEAWLSRTTDQRPALDFDVLKVEALVAILHAIEDRGRDFLPELVNTTWQPAWLEACARDRDNYHEELAVLLGLVKGSVPHAANLWRTLPLPDHVARKAGQRLDTAVTAGHSLGETHDIWADLFLPDPDDAAWLSAWRQASAGTLFWAAVRVARVNGRTSTRLFSALGGTPAGRAYLTLSEGRSPEAADGAALVQALPGGTGSAPELDFLIASLRDGDGSTLGAFVLADLAGRAGHDVLLLRQLTSRALTREAWFRRVLRNLIEAVDAGSPQMDAGMARVLLAGWSELGVRQKASVDAALGPRLGQPIRWLLLGVRDGAENGDLAALGNELCLQRLGDRDETTIGRLAECCSGSGPHPTASCERATLQLIEAWLGTSRRATAGLPDIFRAMSALLRGRPMPRVTLTAEEMTQIALVFRAMPSPPDLGVLLANADSEGGFRAVFELLPDDAPVTPPPGPLKLLILGMVGSEEVREYWKDTIRRQGLQDRNAWRFLWNLATRTDAWAAEHDYESMCAVEQRALDSLSGAQLLLVLQRAWYYPPRAQLDHINRRDLYDHPPDYDQLAWLARLARGRHADHLLRRLAALALHRVRREGTTLGEVRESLRKPPLLGRAARSLGSLVLGDDDPFGQEIDSPLELLCFTTERMSKGEVRALIDRHWR